jgi:hypothetical protein
VDPGTVLGTPGGPRSGTQVSIMADLVSEMRRIVEAETAEIH